MATSVSQHVHDRRCSRHKDHCKCGDVRRERLLCNEWFEGDYCPDGGAEGFADVAPPEESEIDAS